MNLKTKTMVRIGFLGAAGFVLMLIEFPILPSAAFLKYDPGDVPPLLAAFGMGPLAGIIAEVIKNVLFHLSGKGTAGIVGLAANFLAGAALVATAGAVYAWNRTLKGAVLGMLAGTVVMSVVMYFANVHFFFPLWGISPALRPQLALTASTPFNVIKGLLTGLITFVLYKRVSRFIH